MNPNQFSQFIVNSITKHYFREVAHGALRPGQIKRDARQIYKDYNPLKIHIFKYKHPRMLEIIMPGHQRRAERVEAQRRRNREQINFFCRYVLAKQGKTIPYN
ncbi:hypothetical protein ABPG74_012943 [Tetrahymena malaccensis]